MDDREQLFADIDTMKAQVAELTGPRPPAESRMSAYPRIAVQLTQDEFQRFSLLAHRLQTSVSALGQLALRQMLTQAEAGAAPMLPVSSTAKGAYFPVTETDAQATINLATAQLELLRLSELAGRS